MSFAPLNSTQQARWPPTQCTGMPNAQDNIQLQLFLHSRAPWYNNSIYFIIGLLHFPGSNIFGLLRLNNLIGRPFFKPIQPLPCLYQLYQLYIINSLTSILYIKYTTSLQQLLSIIISICTVLHCCYGACQVLIYYLSRKCNCKASTHELIIQNILRLFTWVFFAIKKVSYCLKHIYI